MDSSGPLINLELFEKEYFNAEAYVKKVAAESIYATNIAETKDKLNRSAQQTAEEIKQSVYKNYSNFMETAKEVGHLEGKMSQLRQSLDEQRKLLSLFKNFNININPNANPNDPNNKNSLQKSSLSLLLEQVEGCGLIAQKPGRNLLYHSDLEALHIDDYSVSHKLHAYLLSDAILLTLPQRKRNKSNYNAVSTSLNKDSSRLNSSTNSDTANSYQFKFQAFYELQDITIMNIDDSKEVRNAFQLRKFPESLAFRCANAHIKKEWLENIENAKKQLKQQLDANGSNKTVGNETIHEEDEEFNSDDEERNKKKEKIDYASLNLATVSEHERNKILRELFSDFDITLSQRDFEKAVEMLLKIKHSKSANLDAVQQLVYKQKETELINILRKDLIASKERGNNKGVVKTGKRVVNSLIKLKIYDEAIDLFIDYHKHLNHEMLRKIKLEESNTIYMNNVLNLFFDNLKMSYASFREAFADLINYCYSTYISWCDTEIEILIKKLQSQHYLGRHFDLTIENSQLIFDKAQQFSEANNFEVKFLFETKLSPILETNIKEQSDIIIDASVQRSKLELEDSPANNELNRQGHITKLLKDLDHRNLMNYLSDAQLKLIHQCTSSAIQFARSVLVFFCDCLKVFYQDVNFCIVETFTKLFKAELKIYTMHLTKNLNNKSSQAESAKQTSNKLKKQDIYNNICFIEAVFGVIQKLYYEQTGVNSKFFAKLAEKFAKFKEDNFI